ncbi:phospholipase D-like domain-containing protein [Spirochaeta africana]|uniref:Phosphatidylserine/phosphatidylglycerophosphate/ cardiolipin synthase n=1 Tax=Spirochaeta africana (strain ATCC 700263 / DSM 8902 / Z-7692) TaxID=889378 RepID=H9UM00_SPIAZ|nr:phospholipase D-like domain-containing protein [Spirochaeta africana]AFG38543.1 phosphatidylserine/phosphatidylglycerophosphate/cardiolipin synthase [Spirochaeta africana DSM 8902]
MSLDIILSIGSPLRRFLAWSGILLLAYLAYFFIGGVLAFGINTTETVHQDIEYYSPKIGPDRVVLLEDRVQSGIARLDLIRQAETSIDIAYYTITQGVAAELYLSALLEAAERGVEVRILLDGIFHNMRRKLADYRHAMAVHPGIEIAVYEPFSPIHPWRIQNRLHDKIMLVDGNKLLIGGRNIGDRYYLADHAEPVFDRDVLLLHTSSGNPAESVLPQAEQYYHKLWQSRFVRQISPPRWRHHRQKAAEHITRQIDWLDQVRQSSDLLPSEPIDWKSCSLPTRKVTFLHNPLERMHKQPVIWSELTALASTANTRVYLQSPYIILDRAMLRLAPDLPTAPITMLTNSAASSPNLPALAGYLNSRDAVSAAADRLYEYHGAGSIHAKTYIIDDRLSLIGAFNLDPRSSFLSTESLVAIDSPELAAEILVSLDSLLASSARIDSDLTEVPSPDAPSYPEISRGRRLKIAAMRLLIYPFAYML